LKRALKDKTLFPGCVRGLGVDTLREIIEWLDTKAPEGKGSGFRHFMARKARLAKK